MAQEWRKRKFGKRMTPKAEREVAQRGRIEAAGCRKITYADKTAAKVALRVLQAKRRHEHEAGLGIPGKGEQSVYRCRACRGWHLTSLPQGGPGGQVLSRRQVKRELYRVRPR